MNQWQPRVLSPEEIQETLTKALTFGGVVERPLIFSRESFQITKMHVSGNDLVIEVNEFIPPHEESRHLCIDLRYRRMSFILKVNSYTIEGNIIRTKIPVNAKAIMERPTPRYKLDYQEFPSFISRAERRGGAHEHQCFVEDISLSGICLLLKKTDEGDELKIHDHIWIKSIANKEMTSPFFAKVIYTKIVRLEGHDYIKVGAELDQQFDEEFFSDFIKCALKTLVA
jgi:hypothetical protein